MAAPVLRNASDSYVSEKYPAKNYSSVQKLYLADNSAADTRYGFIYFGIPSGMFGTTVLSAKVRIRSGTGFSGSVTMTLQRAAAKYTNSKVNWNNKPGVTGYAVDVTKSNAAQGTEWEFDVTAQMQTVANGAPWYGFRLSATNSTAKWVYSANGRDDYRPVLEIQWSDAPHAPSVLIPDNGQAVSISKPVLQWDFTDPNGDTSMESLQVRLFSSLANAQANASAILDTGTVAADNPQLDLADTAYGGLADGGTLWWRVRVQDGAGLWSAWSDYAYFTRVNKGTLTIVNPAGTGQVLYTNLALNPHAASTTNWAVIGVTANTRTLDAAFGHEGNNSNKVVLSASGGLGARAITSETFADGNTIRWSVWIYSSRAVSWQPYWERTSPSYLGGTGGAAVAVPANTWTKITGEVTLGAGQGGTVFGFGAYANTGLLSGDTFWIDEAIIVKNTVLPEWFAGDSTDTHENQYDWTGTAHASTSIYRNPPYVEDNTPPFMWTYTGQTQRAYEVLLTLPSEPGEILWRSGVVTSTDQAVTPPRGIIDTPGVVYRVYVRVYDTVNRRWTPGDPSYTQAYRDFTYQYDPTTDPVTSFTASPDGVRPKTVLQWQRSAAPDYFVILRNGKVIDTVEPSEVFVSGTTYRYTDRNATPRKTHTWSVAAKINGRTSATNPTDSGMPKLVTTVLMDLDQTDEVFLFNPDVQAAKAESSDVHYPLGNAEPVLITQSLRGYEGTVSGVIADGIVSGLTLDAQLDSLAFFRRNPGRKLALAWKEKNIKVIIYNVTESSISYPDGRVDHAVSFSFFQVDF